METANRTLPEISVFYNKDDVKFALFQQSEVISDRIREQHYWGNQNLNVANGCLSKLSEIVDRGTVLDIGSGFGSFSIPLAINNNEKFNFVCFEPVDFLTTQFATNKLLNCLNNVVVHQVGISNRNETIDYPTMDPYICGNHGSFSFAEEYDTVRGIFNTKYKVKHEMRTIDSYNFTDVKFVKITVNGFEKKVLEGMEQTLIKSEYPPILIELWNDDFFIDGKQEVLDCLAKLGYNHIHKMDAHVLAFPSTENFQFFMGEAQDPESSISDADKLELQSLLTSFEQKNNGEVENSTEEFKVVEKLHDVDSTLESQQIYKPD